MFGLSKGKLTLKVNGVKFNAGATIRGTILLDLKKPIKAKALSVQLVAQQDSLMWTGNRLAPRHRTVVNETVWLGKEKTYAGKKVYNYSIKAPKKLPQVPKVTPKKLLKIIVNPFEGYPEKVRWYIIARLDIPWRMDLAKKVQIIVE